MTDTPRRCPGEPTGPVVSLTRRLQPLCIRCPLQADPQDGQDDGAVWLTPALTFTLGVAGCANLDAEG